MTQKTISQLTCAFLLLPLVASAAEEAPKSPLSPADSLKHFKLHPGLTIEVVAAEPDVIDPVAVRFDEAGRMWVVEMRDYPHGPKDGEPPKSRIKVLEDRDGDGRFETVKVFANKLLFATGVQPWKGGVFVTMAGRVAYMKDTTGDGKADHIETWYEGFAQANSQLRANHPRLGLDGYIYVANGLRGGAIVDARSPKSKPLSISGMDFRFDPHTRKFEAVSGVGQFGLTFDDDGNRFVCSNRNPLKHIVLENHYLEKVPSFAVPSLFHDVAKAGADSRVYPISRAWTTSNLHAGQFTAACGVLLYRGDGLPKAFHGNGFTCDPTGNLVHREVLTEKGPTFTSKPGREGVEFLASPDEWFRPVNLEHGPDGSLYVVDMYRAVIEHPQWVPEELKERADLMLGIDRGRIYRIRETSLIRNRRNDLSNVPLDDLSRRFHSTNAWHRETTARLFSENRDEKSTAILKRMPPLRLTLWLLEGKGELTTERLFEVIGGIYPRVQEQAIRILEKRLPDERPDVVKDARTAFLQIGQAADDRLRFQALLSLAPVNETEAATLINFAKKGVDSPWYRQALLMAASEYPHVFLNNWLRGLISRREEITEGEYALLHQLAEQAGRRAPVNALVEIVDYLTNVTGIKNTQSLQVVTLRHLLQGAARQKISWQQIVDERKIKPVFDRAAKTAQAKGAFHLSRIEAIQLLVFSGEDKDLIARLATGGGLPAVRTQAISALSRVGDLEAWKTLIKKLPSESPTMRQAILSGVLARTDRVSLLLDEIAAGRIKANGLDRLTVNRLTRHGDPKIKSRVQKLMADAIPADRKKVLADYQVVLKMKADPKRGLEMFKKNCATCHRIGDVGVNVAPDISDSRTKQPVQILADVLQPNRAIDGNYVSYTAVTIDGRILTGIMATETSTSITLKQPEGKTVTLPRSEIEVLKSTGLSLMPEGLEKNLPPQAMADLIAYIKNWRYLDGKTPLGK